MFTRTPHSVLNDAGDVLFSGSIKPEFAPPISSYTTDGLRACDASADEIIQIVRVGQFFDVSAIQDGSGMRVVAALYANSSGSELVFNDPSLAVSSFGFIDETRGLFITTVPAPGAAILLGVASCVTQRRRR